MLIVPIQYRQGIGGASRSAAAFVTALLLLLTTLIRPISTYAASITVINTQDSGAGSLRQAILDANATPAHDTINFNIPGSGVHTIDLLSVLPIISAPVTIDGYSQSGAQPNTLAQGSNALLLIELSGRGSNGLNMVFGLKITAGGSIVRGLVINRFGYESASTGQFYPGIVLQTNGNNSIEGNYIGTDAAGAAKLGNGGDGVQINGVSNNVIGGATPAARNVISGNGNYGVAINGSPGSPTAMNVVQGNYIGTNADGTTALENLHGVLISDATGNVVGGIVAGAGNLISGNHIMGVDIVGPGATNNLVQGNYIGTDASGAVAVGNSYGVRINSATGNTIGGPAAGARNVISGNTGDGIKIGYIGQGTTSANIVQGNYIGTDISGNKTLGNVGSGIAIAGASSTVIGGVVPGAGNLISGNHIDGIFLYHESTSNTVVQGNIIGANSAASENLGNLEDGVHIENSPHTTIGGPTIEAGNVIAFNGANGVYVSDTRYTAVGNLITSNTIFSNTLLGIEVTLKRQERPTLSYAYNRVGATQIRGTVVGQAGMAMTLQFFTNHVCDASGDGEGESLLGTATVTADSSGMAQIAFVPASQVSLGRFVTVLATDVSKNTSKFSNCVKVVVPSEVFIPLVKR